jgi:hypothetical protein
LVSAGGGSDYTDAELSQSRALASPGSYRRGLHWVERIVSQKWERAFVFFKHEDEAKGPELAMRFQEFVEAGTSVPRRKAVP